MLHRARAATALMVGLAGVLTAPRARAEEPYFVPAPADPFGDAKRRGDDALVSGRAAEALASYEAAYAVRPDPALIYNMARAHQALNDFAAALDLLEKFDTTAPTGVRARVPGLPTLRAAVQKRVATFVVSCDVPGATVRVDSRAVGTTPLARPVRVNATSRQATVSVEKDGYFRFARVTTPEGGAIVTLDVKLTATDSAGIVTVRSATDGALVAVDGKPEGTLPSEIVMTPGTHRLEITRSGFRASETSLDVAAGERRTVDVTLTRESPITKTWWFWTGIGLVAAGTVAVVIAASTERDPDTGNLGSVKTGLSF